MIQLPREIWEFHIIPFLNRKEELCCEIRDFHKSLFYLKNLYIDKYYLHQRDDFEVLHSNIVQNHHRKKLPPYKQKNSQIIHVWSKLSPKERLKYTHFTEQVFYSGYL